MKNVYAWFALTVAAVVSMSAQAAGTNNGAQSARRYINLSKVVQAPFSDGVLVWNTLYLSDQIGIDPNTGKLPNDVEQEARTALDRVKSILAEAGMSMDDLVFVQVFCTDMSLYSKFNEVYKTYFAKDYPARTFVASGSGPRGVGAHFEINGIAVKR
jgi:reactive intermediate/imine deaminase